MRLIVDECEELEISTTIPYGVFLISAWNSVQCMRAFFSFVTESLLT